MPAVTTQEKGARRPCAECRRLKIKCDREIPCSNCNKRGVAKLCPEGKLTYGGGRFVLAGTTELHDRIQELSVRVRKLEAALESAYAATTADTHPLLREEARVDISSVEVTRLDEAEVDPEDQELMNSTFSMLSIDEDVRTSRFTPSHYSLWYLDGKEDTQDRHKALKAPHPHHAPSAVERSSQETGSPFPIELLRITSCSYEKPSDLSEKLRACLPPVEIARSLVESYYDVPGSLHDIVPKSLLEEEYWPCAYGCKDQNNISSLAVVFGILSLGALLHPALPVGALSAAQYNQLAALAMTQDALSITHIEGLMLYAIYLCSIDDTHSKAWACMGMTIKFAQTLGIDRECRTWQIPEKALQRRRRVFNELHALDCYLSMLVGRSNFLSKGQHNSPIPQPSATLSPLEKAYAWKYLFLGEGVQSLLALVMSTNIQPTYDATLALDKKLRAYNVILDPKYLKELGTAPIGDDRETKRLRISQEFTFLARESTLLHLHRSFMNRAIMHPTGDPILGKWSISVMAAYQSACAIIRQIRLIRDHQPAFMYQLSWPNAVLAAVITLGALVIKAPFSSLANVAYEELLSGCELLRNFFDAKYYLLPVLENLQRAATQAYSTREVHPLKPSVFPLPDVRRPLDEAPTVSVSTPPTNDSTNGITPPAAAEETLGSIFGAEDSAIFSTSFPLDPNIGGMNWHFLPPPDTFFGFGDMSNGSANGIGPGFGSGPGNGVGNGIVVDGVATDPQLDFGKADGVAWQEFLNQLGMATGNPSVTV